jgi:hypothetical protein
MEMEHRMAKMKHDQGIVERGMPNLITNSPFITRSIIFHLLREEAFNKMFTLFAHHDVEIKN